MPARKSVVFWLGLVASCIGGCEQAHTYPSDPIFASKQPTISQPQLRPPAVVAYGETPAPDGTVVSCPASAANPTSGGTSQVITVRGQAPQ
jgi:hypothetical protein